ncbi:hypothetical protein BGZ68_002552 [Mortierella alpina]|nr:hypothetical protein BGZ68_002552 [Mortierella alpina]
MTFLSSRKSTANAATTAGAPSQSSAPLSLPSSGSQVTLVDDTHQSAKLKASKVALDENKGSGSKSKEKGPKSASDFKVSALAEYLCFEQYSRWCLWTSNTAIFSNDSND